MQNNHPPFDHNGPIAFDNAADLPRQMPRMHFFLCDIDALWDVIIDMPLEQAGFYLRVLLAMYRHMEGLPADDNMARMRLGGMDIRTYTRMRDLLLARQKCLIRKPSGRISNERFEEEITSYVLKWKRKHDAAIERERVARAKRTQNARVAYGNQPTSAGSRTEVGRKSDGLFGKLSENVNQINGTPTTNQPQPHHNQIPLELESSTRLESRDSSDPESQASTLSETRVSDRGRKSPYSDLFEAFWRGYPETRGMSKLKAWQRWSRMDAMSRDQAIAALPALKSQLADRRSLSSDATPVHAERYLSQRRFETLIPSKTPPDDSPWWRDQARLTAMTAEQWTKLIAQHANGVWPTKALGPPPGSPRCVVPSAVIAELRLTEIYTDAGIRR